MQGRENFQITDSVCIYRHLQYVILLYKQNKDLGYAKAIDGTRTPQSQDYFQKVSGVVVASVYGLPSPSNMHASDSYQLLVYSNDSFFRFSCIKALMLYRKKSQTFIDNRVF
jgi:hypothetical protein